MTKTKFTAEQKKQWKEEKQNEQRQLLEDALEQINQQAVWQNFVKYGRSNLAKYSFNNAILIFVQKNDATLVKGKKTWAREKITVNEDAKPIRILAPVFVAVRDEEGNQMFDEDGKPMKRVGFFKVVTVYDVDDTDAPKDRDPEVRHEIGGNNPELMERIPALENFAREMGFEVKYYQKGEHKGQGYVDWANAVIGIQAGLPGNDTVRTWLHELAHAYGHINYTDYERGTAETIVESATVMTLGMVGFDVSEVSVPYIAGWGGDAKLLREFMGTVDDLASTLAEKMGL
jgi:hypothetical protein